MELKFYDIIKEPIITEKSMQLKEQYNKYTFKVAPNANKIEIKNAVEALFNVKVLSVNTINVLPKIRELANMLVRLLLIRRQSASLLMVIRLMHLKFNYRRKF